MLEINGIYWEIKLVSPNHPAIRRLNGEYALAACDDTTKCIYLRSDIPSYKIKKVLCHEITHAAMFSYGVIITAEQEELIADIIATYGEEIIDKTNIIFNRIKLREVS